MQSTHGTTRREFGTAAAAAALTLPTVGAGQANSNQPDSNQLRYGVIGTGARGRQLLASLNRAGSERLAVVCDKQETAAQRAVQSSPHPPDICCDYRRVLDRKDVDAVIVATPPHTHFTIVRDALLAGKHVWCENVLVLKPDEVLALRKVAEAHPDRIVQVGLQHRYSDVYRTAKQMVAKGYLGEFTNVQAQWHRNQDWVINPQQSREGNWRFYREFSGGLTSELASHHLDIGAWMFADDPEMLTGIGGLDWTRDGRDIYDNIYLLLQYPGGGKMVYSSISSNQHLPLFGGTHTQSGLVLIGTEGTIEISFNAQGEPIWGVWFYEPSPIRPAAGRKEGPKLAGATAAAASRNVRGMPILLERDQISGEESFSEREYKYARQWLFSKGVMTPQPERNALDAQFQSFFECCRDGKQPKANLETALNNSITVMLANLAMDEGRRVRFDEFPKLAANTANKSRPGHG